MCSFNSNGHNVERVTVGISCNDFNSVLKEYYKETTTPKTLTGYYRYTDASRQYTLLDNSKTPIKEKTQNLDNNTVRS